MGILILTRSRYIRIESKVQVSTFGAPRFSTAPRTRCMHAMKSFFFKPFFLKHFGFPNWLGTSYCTNGVKSSTATSFPPGHHVPNSLFSGKHVPFETGPACPEAPNVTFVTGLSSSDESTSSSNCTVLCGTTRTVQTKVVENHVCCTR